MATTEAEAMIHQVETVGEVAKRKGVTESAVRFLIANSRQLEGVKIKGRLYVLKRSSRVYAQFPRSKTIQAGKMTREIAPGTIASSILCPDCSTDFFQMAENNLTLNLCPNCGWPAVIHEP